MNHRTAKTWNGDFQSAEWTAAVRELAVGRTLHAARFVASANGEKWLHDFVDGNLQKRIDKLRDQFEFGLELLTDFDGRVSRYVREVPLAAFDTGTTDSARFARWLERRQTLSAAERDVLRTVRARTVVEELARRRRIPYLQFHERSRWSRSLDRSEVDVTSLMPVVNPIRLATFFETRELLDDDSDANEGGEFELDELGQSTPAESSSSHDGTVAGEHVFSVSQPLPAHRGRIPVVFFASDGNISTVELETPARNFLQQMACESRRTLADWLNRDTTAVAEWDEAETLTGDELFELVESAVELGLLAYS